MAYQQNYITFADYYIRKKSGRRYTGYVIGYGYVYPKDKILMPPNQLGYNAITVDIPPHASHCILFMEYIEERTEETIKQSLKGLFSNGEATYIVSAGDTLPHIAKWFDVSVEDILAWNSGIENPNTILPNQKIIIKDKKPIPRKTIVKQPIDNTFIKTYLHFQIGGGKPLNLSTSSLNFNGITQKDLIYNPKNNTYSIDLYKVNPTSQTALALGKISLMKVGFNTYSILPDKYDFNIEWHKGFSKRNIATFGASILHYGVGISPIIPTIFGGPFEIHFQGTITINPF